ncbi:sec-independent translocase [Streptomyces sp. NPDC059169]|uniref:sec-independent translocase n=1 Tax=unclassified Streptomyces TaxID=2593676 RepID=UPI00368787A1
MLTDLSPLKLLVLAVVAVLVLGPERLPAFVRSATAVLRKVRSFADDAEREIRSELGPEYQDFAFEGLHPRAFVRRHLAEGGDGLRLAEAADHLDVRKDLTEVGDALGEVAAPFLGDTGQRPGSFTKAAPQTTPTGPRFDDEAT